MSWKKCKRKFKQEYLNFLPLLTQLYNEGGEFYTEIKKAAEKYFTTVVDKQKSKPQFQAYREKKTDAFIIKQYVRYLLEEAAMMAAWDKRGFEQMGYPHSRNEISLDVYNAILNAIEVLRHRSGTSEKACTSMRLLDIKIVEKQTSVRSATARKGSLDSSALTQQEKYIKNLKDQKRKLHDEIAKLKNHISTREKMENELQAKIDDREKQNWDEIRSRTFLEDESGFHRDLLENQTTEIDVLRTDIEALKIEIELLENIAYTQAKDLSIKDKIIQEKDNVIRELQKTLQNLQARAKKQTVFPESSKTPSSKTLSRFNSFFKPVSQAVSQRVIRQHTTPVLTPPPERKPAQKSSTAPTLGAAR